MQNLTNQLFDPWIILHLNLRLRREHHLARIQDHLRGHRQGQHRGRLRDQDQRQGHHHEPHRLRRQSPNNNPDLIKSTQPKREKRFRRPTPSHLTRPPTKITWKSAGEWTQRKLLRTWNKLER